MYGQTPALRGLRAWRGAPPLLLHSCDTSLMGVVNLTLRMRLRARALRCRSLRPLLADPLLVVVGAQHVQPALHPGVPEPAQLGTGDLVFAWLVRLEPRVDFPAGHRVLFET